MVNPAVRPLAPPSSCRPCDAPRILKTSFLALLDSILAAHFPRPANFASNLLAAETKKNPGGGIPPG
jgi:hypothetical protein